MDKNKIERFRNVIDFSKIEHLSDSIHVIKGSNLTVPETARNMKGFRTSMTALAGGMVNEVFALHQLRKRLPEDGFMLDVGCGEPNLFELMSNTYYFPYYVGVDIRIDALGLYGKNPKNLCLLNGNLVDLDCLIPGTFDGIVFNEVLEHLPVDIGDSVLHRIHELVHPSGFVVLTCPIWPEGNTDIDMDVEEEKWGHITYYKSDELTDKLEKMGFNIEHKSYAKFNGRRIDYRKIRIAMIGKGKSTSDRILFRDVFDRVASIYSPFLAASIFADYAGDIGGHIQLVLSKK